MEKERGNWVGYSQLAEHGRVQGRIIRLPPKRGQIKKEIFASIARLVMRAVTKALNALKCRGIILSKRSHEIMASFIVCCCEKGRNSVPSSVGVDLLRVLNEGHWESN
eukprot:Gb_35327 [translate_table: standard]